MPATLTIRDETIPGSVEAEYKLELPSETLTVRELIRSRVYQEVKDHNLKKPEYYQGLVQPSDTEKTLNGFRFKKASKNIDWKKQFEKALEAFQRNGFLILVDDKQVTELEEEIELKPGSSATFLKLVPLVGG